MRPEFDGRLPRPPHGASSPQIGTIAFKEIVKSRQKNPIEIQLVIWVYSAPQLQQITPSNPLPVDIDLLGEGHGTGP
jgi:hypothetical protein